MNRRPFILVSGRLVPLVREPHGDGVVAALNRGEAVCIECGADLSDSVWSAYVNLFRCGCGSLYGLRYRSVVVAA